MVSRERERSAEGGLEADAWVPSPGLLAPWEMTRLRCQGSLRGGFQTPSRGDSSFRPQCRRTPSMALWSEKPISG